MNKIYLRAIIAMILIVIIGSLTVISAKNIDITGMVTGIFEKPLTAETFSELCVETNGTMNNNGCRCYYSDLNVMYVDIRFDEVNDCSWDGCGDWTSNKDETTTTPEEFLEGCTSNWIPSDGVCVCYREESNWNYAVTFRDVYYVDWEGCGDWSMWNHDEW